MTDLASLFLDPEPLDFLRALWPSLLASAKWRGEPDPKAAALLEVKDFTEHMLTTEGCAMNDQPIRPTRGSCERSTPSVVDAAADFGAAVTWAPPPFTAVSLASLDSSYGLRLPGASVKANTGRDSHFFAATFTSAGVSAASSSSSFL